MQTQFALKPLDSDGADSTLGVPSDDDQRAIQALSTDDLVGAGYFGTLSRCAQDALLALDLSLSTDDLIASSSRFRMDMAA